MRMVGFCMAIAMSLAACGGGDEREVASGSITDDETGKTTDYRVTSDKGGENSSVTVKNEEGVATFGSAGAKLPPGFTPFPGSTITGGFTSDTVDGSGGMTTFTAKVPPAQIVAHYRRQAEAQGMKQVNNIQSDDTTMLTFEGKGGLTVQIIATQEGDSVSGSVSFGKENGTGE